MKVSVFWQETCRYTTDIEVDDNELLAWLLKHPAYTLEDWIQDDPTRIFDWCDRAEDLEDAGDFSIIDIRAKEVKDGSGQSAATGSP